MKIKIEKSNELFCLEQCKAIEELLSFRMPSDFKKFLIEYNGGVPETNFIDIPSAKNASCISEFLSVNKIIKEIYDMQGRFLDMVIPIADDVCGNYICLSCLEGREGVYFWDHELEAEEGQPPTWDNMFYIAGTFDSFLNMLEKENPNNIEVKPEGVEVIYSNPEFMEKMRRMGILKDKEDEREKK